MARGKKRRSEGNKAQNKSTNRKHKIKAIEDEIRYAGGSRLQWLKERLEFWKGK